MIFVNREEISIPSQVLENLKKETAIADKFFHRKDRAQERFTFNKKIWQQAKQYLSELFDDTCAYCETKVNGSSSDVEHFRPKSEACNLEGITDPDWYWWLAYRWENLYLVCQTCNFSKKTLFPVVGKRAPVGAAGNELKKEKNLLLDPCVDEPAVHLQFLEDGFVRSISLHDRETQRRFQNIDRGAVTIDVLGLNRSDLINFRLKTSLFIAAKLDQLKEHSTGKKSTRPVAAIINELISETYPFGEYVAVKRQIIARRLVRDQEFRQFLLNVESEKLQELEENIATELKVEKSLYRKDPSISAGRDIFEKSSSKNLQFISRPRIKFDNAYIRKVEIQNFRTINELEINFNEWESFEEKSAQFSSSSSLTSTNLTEHDTERRVGWKMLLGENGAGKSSFLKALALALMGQDHYETYKEKYLLTPARIFNKKTRRKEGLIRVELSKGDPIHIRFTRSNLEFVSGAAGATGVFIRGYGAARLFSRASDIKTETDADEVKKVDNLFHPEHLLKDPNQWLNGLNKRAFDSVGLVLRDLLNLSPDIKRPLTKRVIKHKREVFLDSGFGPLPLVDQSDGYNSILALMADIMMGLPETMHDKKQATGIVLLDEIDAHLHPRWKMQIVGSLRRCFPNIQFITTTHEPLCLRGLCSGEITVMKRLGDRIVVKNDVPSPAGLRVDQLLTSELFGLDSTIDPAVDLQFQEYYQLLALNDPTPAQAERIEELRGIIKQYNVLGSTPRDQMVYDSIDKYIAEERKQPVEAERQELREQTKNTILNIWTQVIGINEGGGNGNETGR